MVAMVIDAEGTTFEDLLPFIRAEAYRFSQQYLTDTEELESHANWIFHRAWMTFNPDNGKFRNWLRFLLWKIWLEHVRRAAQRHARLPRTDADLGRIAVDKASDAEEWLSDLFEDLSDDARYLVELTLDTPADAKRFIRYSLRLRYRKI
jgi:DNA-directed RNA polymerase specialized sigma24 family protein